MRMIMLFVLTLGLTGQQSEVVAGNRLIGCPNPSEIAKAVAKLREKDWREITVAGLQEIWPGRLEVIQREAGKFMLIGTQGRIILGQCQCCETFDFAVEGLSGGTQSERLTRLIVKYSSTKRVDVVDAAKRVARAAGLDEGDVATIGRLAVQDFGWQDAKGQETFGLELNLTQAKGVWTADISLARYRIEH